MKPYNEEMDDAQRLLFLASEIFLGEATPDGPDSESEEEIGQEMIEIVQSWEADAEDYIFEIPMVVFNKKTRKRITLTLTIETDPIESEDK
jgi:hypothetical protein